MQRPRSLLPSSVLAWVVGFAVLTTLLVWAGRAVIPPGKACPDYICYWAAGKNLAAGQSPYDVDAQTRIQHALGWDKTKDGLGIYEFLPFYYPPWFAMLCAAFVPLGYETARIAWQVVNLELVLLTAYLLRDLVPGVPRAVPLAVVPLFIFTDRRGRRRPDVALDLFPRSSWRGGCWRRAAISPRGRCSPG